MGIDQNHYHSTAIVLGLRHHSVLAQTNPPINNWQHHPTTAHHVVRYNHHPRSPICKQQPRAMSMPGMSTSMDTAMSMPGMSMSSTSMDPAMSMPNAMSSGMTMTTTASSAKSSLMASATSTSSSSSATVSTNAAPGSTGPSEAMIAAIGLVTWVALGVSNVF